MKVQSYTKVVKKKVENPKIVLGNELLKMNHTHNLKTLMFPTESLITFISMVVNLKKYYRELLINALASLSKDCYIPLLKHFFQLLFILRYTPILLGKPHFLHIQRK